jgi:hypothetical protein
MCDARMPTLDPCIQHRTGHASERKYTRNKCKHVKQEGILSFLFPYFCKIREQRGAEQTLPGEADKTGNGE